MKDWSIKILLALCGVLAPVYPLLIATGVLILIDLITGVTRAIKHKEKILSSAGRRTVTKIAVYNTAIITGLLLENYLLQGIPATKLIGSVIGLVEAKSILENLDEIYGTPIFKVILKKLGSDNDKS